MAKTRLSKHAKERFQDRLIPAKAQQAVLNGDTHTIRSGPNQTWHVLRVGKGDWLLALEMTNTLVTIWRTDDPCNQLYTHGAPPDDLQILDTTRSLLDDRKYLKGENVQKEALRTLKFQHMPPKKKKKVRKCIRNVLQANLEWVVA